MTLNGLPSSVSPVERGLGNGTRVALILWVMTDLFVLAQGQLYPGALMALGQESLSEGAASRRGRDREAHCMQEGQLGDRAQVAGASRGRRPEL